MLNSIVGSSGHSCCLGLLMVGQSNDRVLLKAVPNTVVYVSPS